MAQSHLETQRQVNEPLNMSAEMGHNDGYQLGRLHGNFLGRCEAAFWKVPMLGPEIWQVKVLYVEGGLFNLNQGIIDAIGGMVKELVVAGAFEDIAAIALREKPDIVIVLNGVHGFDVSKLAVIRRYGIKTAVWFADDPYFLDKTTKFAPQYDMVFTHELGIVPYYKEIGCRQVYYLPLAANPYVFHPMRVNTSYRTDVCFVGTGFANRIQFFNQITKALLHRKIMISGTGWNALDDYRQLAGQIRLEGLQPAESVKYYNGAKIVINLHRGLGSSNIKAKVPALSINPRTYEINACGAFQITDIRQDLEHFYQLGTEVETYATPAELVEKINFYLDHETERQKIALNGLRKTVAEHTFVHRLYQMLTCIFGPGQKLGGKKS